MINNVFIKIFDTQLKKICYYKINKRWWFEFITLYYRLICLIVLILSLFLVRTLSLHLGQTVKNL